MADHFKGYPKHLTILNRAQEILIGPAYCPHPAYFLVARLQGHRPLLEKVLFSLEDETVYVNILYRFMSKENLSWLTEHLCQSLALVPQS